MIELAASANKASTADFVDRIEDPQMRSDAAKVAAIMRKLGTWDTR